MAAPTTPRPRGRTPVAPKRGPGRRPKRPTGYDGWLSMEEIGELRDMRAAGKTVAEIARYTRCAENTVTEHTMDLGPMPDGWQHRTVAKEWEIVGLSGRHTQAEIAEIAGVHMRTVHSVQRKYHIVHRFGRCHVAARRYAWDRHAWGRILEELYIEQRLPMGEVAERCGVHVSTVRRRLRELGFRTRTAGEQAIGRTHAAPYRSKFPVCLTPGCMRHVAKAGADFCHDCRRPRRAVAASGYPLV